MYQCFWGAPSSLPAIGSKSSRLLKQEGRALSSQTNSSSFVSVALGTATLSHPSSLSLLLVSTA